MAKPLARLIHFYFRRYHPGTSGDILGAGAKYQPPKNSML